MKQARLKYFIFIFCFLGVQSPGFTTGFSNFSKAKKFLNQNLELYDHKTIYCSCTVIDRGLHAKSRSRRVTPSVDLQSCGYRIQSDAKRARRIEWEHVVPAEAFGQSFIEWRQGAVNCIKKGKRYKGRKCAETNAQFNKMESDLYNLFPEIGELNGLRSNYSMAALSDSERDFGTCRVKLQDRKFEPQDASKGVVARAYLNFDHQYPDRGVVSNKNRPLFDSWNKIYPVTELECRRWKVYEIKNGYPHLFSNQCARSPL